MSATIRRFIVASLSAGAVVAAPSMALAGVSPANVDQSVDPGQSITISKTVTTPEIPPKPDIVLVVDSTGSMGAAIDNVKTEMGTIVSTVQGSQPGAEFAVVDYKDTVDGAEIFTRRTDLTSSVSDAQNAVNAITASGGGDTPEAQLNALWEIGSGGGQIGYRTGSSRIVVWFGDSSGHDPSDGHNLSDAIASLQGVDAKVLAINVDSGAGDGLDATGQATAITTATAGAFFSSTPADLSATILSGLGNLPAEVTADTTCDTGLSVEFSPTLPQTVTSGDTVSLTETVSVAGDAPQGSTLTCTTRFLINGADAGDDFVQTVHIAVKDVTPPTVACDPGVNPAGKTPTGWQQAGFFQLNAADNLPGVTVSVTDNGTGTTFGPYDPATYVKLTQAPGTTTSTAVPMTGKVSWHFTFKGDATITATDAAGNTATATCAVPPANK